MFPMSFFIVLISIICLLLYITRATEENFVMISRNQFKKLQYRLRNASQAKMNGSATAE